MGDTLIQRSSFLVKCFEDFYREVLKHRAFVRTTPRQKTGNKKEASPHAMAEYVLSRLQTFLEEQAVKAKHEGLDNAYAEAQFIMVSLADEVFLHLNWPEKRYWEFNLLEQRMYNTHSAGHVFFEKLDGLLKTKDPARTDLAVLYLNALGLGFQGKYSYFNDANPLNVYRKKLFIFIHHREPSLFQRKIHLFPQAYAHTREGSHEPTFRHWYLVFGGIGLAYLLISSLIWYAATTDMTRMVNTLIQQSRTS
jgi:type VI secretion system protein ImpK